MSGRRTYGDVIPIEAIVGVAQTNQPGAILSAWLVSLRPRRQPRVSQAVCRNKLVSKNRSVKRNDHDSDKMGSQLACLNLTEGQLRVIQGLEKGRQQAIDQAKARGAVNVKQVMAAAIKDLDEGHPARGRAKRIALSLPPDRSGRRLTERSVKRILDRLSVCPISQVQNSGQQEVIQYAK